MIRFRRGDEPAELAAQRRWRLARLQLDWLEWCAASDAAPDDWLEVCAFIAERGSLIDGGYDDAAHRVRDALRLGGHLKCVWCEASIQPSDPLDHFRPRRQRIPAQSCAAEATAAWDDAAHHVGYWWLTWTWDNLLPTCTTCNIAKGTHFPLSTDGRRCAPFQSPDDDGERPLLIDPSRDDPAVLIQYAPIAEDSVLRRPRRLHGPATEDALPRFGPEVIANDTHDRARAEETLTRLKLRSGRLDANWEQHIRYIHKHDIRPLRSDIDQRRKPAAELNSDWTALVDKLVVDPDAPRRALSRALLDHCFPASERTALGFSPLPSLADPSPPPPRAPLVEDTPLRARDAQLALAIEACGSRQPGDLARAWRLYEAAGESLEQLAEALGSTSSRIRERLASGPLGQPADG